MEMTEILKANSNRDIDALSGALLKLPQAAMTLKHHFSDGVYARERFAPQGTLITGKRHRYRTLTILLSGELSVYTENGTKQGESVTHVAPAVFVSDAFTRKVTFSHTDTILMTVHPTNETDLDEIEKQFIITEDDYRLQYPETKAIEGGAI